MLKRTNPASFNWHFKIYKMTNNRSFKRTCCSVATWLSLVESHLPNAKEAARGSGIRPQTRQKGEKRIADSLLSGNTIKKEVMIPMRDEVRLFTSIYLPLDSSKKYPIMLNRMVRISSGAQKRLSQIKLILWAK